MNQATKDFESIPFQIERIILRRLRLKLKEPFTTSGWTTTHKTPVVVELQGGGISGWGECAVPNTPFYNHETPETVVHILRDFAVPLFRKLCPQDPVECAVGLKKIQRNGFARAGLEMAYWDWYAKATGASLSKLLGGTRSEIPVGVSIGIQKDESALLDKVAAFIEKGYQRIKIKVAPGKDIAPVAAIMKRFPSVPLMVDANSAYSLEQAVVFEEMNQFKLLMIEQPLHETEIYEHSLLAPRLKNPICLDESIESARDARAALALKACSIINIKPGRVGGLSEACAIHDLCHAQGIPVWCGGMLESGIGRAANIALASLPGFTLPGDISESSRYYEEDIVEPEIMLKPGGMLAVPSQPGIGFAVDNARLERVTESRLELA